MRRKRMKNRKKDKRVFSKTAKRTRAVNVTPMMYRGGIRL